MTKKRNGLTCFSLFILALVYIFAFPIDGNTVTKESTTDLTKYVSIVLKRDSNRILPYIFQFEEFKDFIHEPGIVPPLIAATDPSNSCLVRSYAAYALGQTKRPEAMEVLLKLVNRWKVKDGICRAAAYAIGEFNDPRVEAALLACMTNHDAKLNTNAAYSLGRLKSHRAIPHLLRLLMFPNSDLRRSIAFALGEIGAPQTLDPLVYALFHEKKKHVRDSMAQAVNRFNDHRCRPIYLKMLNVADKDIRMLGADGLARLGDDSTIPALEQAFKTEKDPKVQESMRLILANLREREGTDSLLYVAGKRRPVGEIFDGVPTSFSHPKPDPNARLVPISQMPVTRQYIHNDGVTQFTAPFKNSRALHHLEQSARFIFFVYETHLTVFDKKSASATIFSQGDGYVPHTSDFDQCIHFDRYVAFSWKPAKPSNKKKEAASTNKRWVTIFDKETQRIQTLTDNEFQEKSAQWKRAGKTKGAGTPPSTKDIKHYNTSIDLPDEPPLLKCTDVSVDIEKRILTSPKEQLNDISHIQAVGDRLFAATPLGLRVFKNQEETGLFQPPQLCRPWILSLAAHNDKLLLHSAKRVDIRDAATLKLLQRLNGRDGAHWMHFDDNRIFYVSGNRFVVERYHKKKQWELYNAYFSAPITRFFREGPLYYIITADGFSSFDPRSLELKHYMGNSSTPYPPEAVDSEPTINDQVLYYVGKLNKRLLFYFEGPKGHLAVLNIEQEMVEEVKSPSIYQQIETCLKQDPGSRIIGEYLLMPNIEKQQRIGFLTLSEDLANRISPRYLGIPPTLAEHFHRPLMNHLPLWRAGGELRNRDLSAWALKSQQVGNILWICTKRGLYSRKVKSNQWKNYFVGTPKCYSENLMATEEGIYALERIDGDSETRIKWSRMDLETFEMTAFDKYPLVARPQTAKNRGNIILHARPDGIGVWDTEAVTFKRFVTPAPVFQVAFYGSPESPEGGFLAAAKETLYLMDTNGNVLKRIPLPNRLTPPFCMKVENDILWMTSEHYFTRVELSSGVCRRMPLREGRDVRAIVPAADDILIITKRHIQRHPRTKNQVQSVADYLQNTNREHINIKSVYDENGDDCYFATNHGVYRFNKSDWKLKLSMLPIKDIRSITRAKNHYYISTIKNGIFRVNQKLWKRSFDYITSISPTKTSAAFKAVPNCR